MPGLVFDLSLADLVAPVLLSGIAYKHLHRKKANCDVFLSFSGEDALKTFANSLCKGLEKAGVCVFRNDDWLHRGEKIGFQAIKSSKISILILSQKYASSRRCLNELVQIMERKNDRSGHIILPIFNRVKPADVQCQIYDFGQKVVKEWKKALNEVRSLKRWESTADRDEGELVELVVRKVLIELKKPLKVVITENSVGIKNPMENIMEFVHSRDSTLYVGIHGKGGVGKTTLAKIIYNKLSNDFEHCSFIADIRESCKCNGIEYLQNQLISDILKEKKVCDKDELITIISSKLKEKKVLILVDDVNANHQLEALVGERNWFAPGSRIIVTTRNKSILDQAEVDYKHEPEEMKEHEAKILFARHAFRRDSIPSEFSSLSHEVVSTIQRFPLALEIIGSYLFGRSLASWKKTEQDLRKWQESQELQESQESQELPRMEVQEILKIVYGALDSEQKKIFLDIACFLVGSDARIASYMWEFSDSHLMLGIEELIFISLIKKGENHELRMHDEVRDFGRSFVREGHCKETDNGSRLWDYEEALKMLERNEGTENIRALSLDKGNSKETFDLDSSNNSTDQECQIYTNDRFTNLQSLRFLHVRDVTFTGELNGTFSRLRWLRWERCPQTLKAMNFGVGELAVLDLSRSMISDDWLGWTSIMRATKMKVLNLTGCRSLGSTFFLSAFKNLEILILRNCDKLNNILPSIGELKTLVSLDLSGCLCLDNLPPEVGYLEGLKELFLDQTEIQEIHSIGSLKKLEILSAKECKLELPDTISELVNLSTIVLSDCSKPLPMSIWSLVKLRHLSLQKCRQLNLNHSSIVNLESLTELVLNETSIMVLPQSIETLQNLETLNVSKTDIQFLPDAIGRLRKLRELDASWCRRLRQVIPSICNLSSLQRLDLLGCLKLEGVPKLPSKLTVVSVTCKSTELPSFSHLTHLKQLRLRNCIFLKHIPELPSTLLELEILQCEALQCLTLPNGVEGYNVSLDRLEIKHCKSLGKLDLSKLNHLRVLYALDCKNIFEIEGLDRLDCLESLIIRGGTSVELETERFWP